MKEEYREQIAALFPFPAAERDTLLGHFSTREVSSGTIILSEGEVATKLFIVIRGCLRAYFIKENGSEITSQFFLENQMVSSFESAMTFTPSRSYIEAIEDSAIGGRHPLGIPISLLQEKRMNKQSPVSDTARANFYVNLAALVPFLVTIATGMVLQLQYHMHHLPDCSPVLGLGRHGWLTLHKISAVTSLACILHHCAHHWKFIVTVTKKKLYRKKMSSAVVSYYLFVIFVPTALTAILSWTFMTGRARFMLVEVHDKLALLLVFVFSAHLVTRAGWMVKTYRTLVRKRPAGGGPS